jgi:hypothetical protein
VDKANALEFLHAAQRLPGVSLSSIGRAVNVDPSQVSRIAAGGFVKLDGHALRVCKYAQQLVQAHSSSSIGIAHSDLARKLAILSNANPEAARALSDLINALADQ